MKYQLDQWKTAFAACLMVASLSAFGERSTNTVGSAVVTVNPGLAIQRSQSGRELLLTLSGTEPKTYVVLSKTSLSDAQWLEESRLDARVTTTITVPLRGREMGFFKVISEDEFLADSALAGGSAATEATVKTAKQAVSSGKDWFVDRVRGHDDFDGRAKNRNGSNGPFASVRKAMMHAAAGDRVIIAGGVYAENLDLRGKNVAVKLEGNVVLH